jgi:cytochrome c-type biogenesis protein CcmH/NrfG
VKRDALIFAVSGTFFGLLVGWILGSQRGLPVPVPAPQAMTTVQPAPGQTQAPAPPPLDVKLASDLERQAKERPNDAAVRIELANLYYDAERFELATPWYEAALKLNPRDVNVSTDLAICYYYTADPDRALQQLDHSLAVDPKHAKTLLNQGVIRAFGKQDLKGAQESWERVIAVAPNSDEARRAQTGLDGLRAAHAPGAAPGTGAPPATGAGSGGGRP